MSSKSLSPIAEARRELRELRAEMKRKGIRRTSCFNGGHSKESLRFNEECFRLESAVKSFGK